MIHYQRISPQSTYFNRLSKCRHHFWKTTENS